eukprot:3780157-Rhodomonas_salina.2
MSSARHSPVRLSEELHKPTIREIEKMLQNTTRRLPTSPKRPYATAAVCFKVRATAGEAVAHHLAGRPSRFRRRCIITSPLLVPLNTESSLVVPIVLFSREDQNVHPAAAKMLHHLKVTHFIMIQVPLWACEPVTLSDRRRVSRLCSVPWQYQARSRVARRVSYHQHTPASPHQGMFSRTGAHSGLGMCREAMMAQRRGCRVRGPEIDGSPFSLEGFRHRLLHIDAQTEACAKLWPPDPTHAES